MDEIERQTKTSTSPEPARILRIKDVMAKTGISRSGIYAHSSTGDFPAKLSLMPGGTAVGWIESEIEEWINQRIIARNQEAQNA
jgi:prophage regulatory protein